jgi:hypothetical protein
VILVIKAEPHKLVPLLTGLKTYMSLSGEVEDFPQGKNKVTVYLHVTFTVTTGNLSIVAPAVPG